MPGPPRRSSSESMASTQEVAVPVGEVVMVKAEAQGDPDDPSKAQVILQLQPISSGLVRWALRPSAGRQKCDGTFSPQGRAR